MYWYVILGVSIGLIFFLFLKKRKKKERIILTDEFKDILGWLNHVGELSNAKIGVIFSIKNGERFLSEVIFNTTRVFLLQQNTGLVKFKEGNEYLVNDPKAFARLLMIINKIFQSAVYLGGKGDKSFRLLEGLLNSTKLLTSAAPNVWKALLLEVSAKLKEITGKNSQLEFIEGEEKPFIIADETGAISPLFTIHSPQSELAAFLIYYFYKNKTAIKPSLLFFLEAEHFFEEKLMGHAIKTFKDKKSQMICLSKSSAFCQAMFSSGGLLAK